MKVSIGGSPRLPDEAAAKIKVGPGSYDVKLGTIEEDLRNKGATIKRRYKEQLSTLTPGPGYYTSQNLSPAGRAHSIPRAETTLHRKSHDTLPGPGSYRPSPTLQAVQKSAIFSKAKRGTDLEVRPDGPTDNADLARAYKSYLPGAPAYSMGGRPHEKLEATPGPG